MRSERRLTGLLVACALSALALGANAQSPAPGVAPAADSVQRPAAEAVLRAAFLYNFALYTEWPASAPEGVTLCVLGQDSLGPALDALAGKHIAGKPVLVRRVNAVAQARTCQLLFIAPSEHEAMPAIVRALQSLPVLTVSEADSYPSDLPMIVLEPEGNRLAFQVNLTKAKAAGLQLSSKLLRLARTVK